MMVNFGKYFKFICRRERIASLIWIVAITASVIVFASLYPGMLPDQEALLGYQAMLDVPTMAAIMGPGYGKEALTPAIVMSHECSIWFAITVIAMNIFFVNRHTRKDEELGRFEMLSALPVGGYQAAWRL
jgi:ABC-2 type transport system permease protein